MALLRGELVGREVPAPPPALVLRAGVLAPVALDVVALELAAEDLAAEDLAVVALGTTVALTTVDLLSAALISEALVSATLGAAAGRALGGTDAGAPVPEGAAELPCALVAGAVRELGGGGGVAMAQGGWGLWVRPGLGQKTARCP
ncbi:hypothetical protein [Cyanobium sp. WAJ14-Wanaka]|uniref:hypothetical protein n=1 Tax=Cyanobium sp. WAJ14-Wanaka TaxID=2823725 RepID=UPI0020CC1B38|nr:hypothetical protein [Cyanobium sp. WAJ14-Wanaka]